MTPSLLVQVLAFLITSLHPSWSAASFVFHAFIPTLAVFSTHSKRSNLSLHHRLKVVGLEPSVLQQVQDVLESEDGFRVTSRIPLHCLIRASPLDICLQDAYLLLTFKNCIYIFLSLIHI